MKQDIYLDMVQYIIRHNLNRTFPVFLIFSIFIFETSTDIYVPCLPAMAHDFGASNTWVIMTMSSYLLGFALLGWVAGPWSDYVGRRPVFIFGLALFTVASLATIFADHIYTLIAARFFQGLGAGVSYVVSNAFIKDRFPARQCSRIFSMIGMVVTIAPMIAPILGAEIAQVYGWRATFYLIFGMAIISFIVSQAALPETLVAPNAHRFSLKRLVYDYQQAMRQDGVVGFSLISAMAYGGLWGWIAQAPFYFMEVMRIDSVSYAWISAIGPAAYIAGTIFNQVCVLRCGLAYMLRSGLMISMVGVVMLNAAVFWGASNIWLCFGAFVVYAFGLAPVFANAATYAVQVPPHMTGTASAILSTAEMFFAALSAFMISWFSQQTLVPATLIMTVAVFSCYGCYVWLGHRGYDYSVHEPS